MYTLPTFTDSGMAPFDTSASRALLCASDTISGVGDGMATSNSSCNMDEATPMDDITSAYGALSYLMPMFFATSGTSTDAPPPPPIILVERASILYSLSILPTVFVISCTDVSMIDMAASEYETPISHPSFSMAALAASALQDLE